MKESRQGAGAMIDKKEKGEGEAVRKHDEQPKNLTQRLRARLTRTRDCTAVAEERGRQTHLDLKRPEPWRGQLTATDTREGAR